VLEYNSNQYENLWIRGGFAESFLAMSDRAGTYQESCPLGVLELNTFLKLTSI
jgi:hypothetical protein